MDDQLNEAREVFCYFDTRGDDRISVAQVGDVLRALGQNPTEAEIQKCCANWPDTDVRITFEDFLPILHTIIKNRVPQSEEKFVEGLSHFDKEGNGYISVAELRHLLTTLGYGLSETVPHDDIASVDFGGGDKNEQAADHPTEEKGPLDAKVDKVTEGKSDSQKEISKILDTVKVNVPKRRIVLSDPFIPEAGVSTVKTSDEQNLGKRKKKRKQNRQKVKEVAPAEKSKKRESADSSGCASKILQGNDRTGQRASLRNSAKRCGRRLKAKSRRLNEQTNPPLVEKHGADTHSLESAFKPQTRSSTSKASTSVSCSTVQNSLHDDHRQPTKGPNNRQHREKLVKGDS